MSQTITYQTRDAEPVPGSHRAGRADWSYHLRSVDAQAP
jgi:hypothetical protein